MKIKKLMLISTGTLMLALTISSCQKDQMAEVVPSGNKMSQVQQIAAYLAQQPQTKNLGNGAIFVDPTFPTGGFSVLQDVVFDPVSGTFTSGVVAGFSAEYGANDFWRENTDGTVSIHLVSNQAGASYSDLASGEAMSGTGNCNFNYSAEVLTIPVPFPPFELTLMVPAPDQNGISIHGHANVTVDGLPGPSSKLAMKIVQNPSGNNNVSITLK